MTYRIYKAEPMTRKMIRVMQDWHAGPDSLFFKVSIGAAEDKKICPSTPRQFRRIADEAAECLAIMHPNTRAESPDDVPDLEAVKAWADRQSAIYCAREKMRATIRAALDVGMPKDAVVTFAQNVAQEWAMPAD